MKTGDVKRAVLELWNVDAMLTGSFGLLYLDLPEAERARAQRAFADFIAAPFASPKLTEMFKTLEVSDATTTVLDASTVAVRLQIAGDGGRFHAQNEMLLQKSESGWRIVDQRQGDQMSMRAALVMTCVAEMHTAADTLPVVLERVAAQVQRQSAGR